MTVEHDANITTLGLEGWLHKARKQTRVSPNRPPVIPITNAVAHPGYTALYDTDGRRIPDTSMYVMPLNSPAGVVEKFIKARAPFEPERIDLPALANSDQKIVFGGASNSHFGHHLTDGLSRAWFHSARPTLHLDAHPDMLGQREFISTYRSLGRPRTLYTLEVPTLFAEVIVPMPSMQHSFRIYDNADTEHLAISANALELAVRPVAPKVYLSRSGVSNRRTDGELELESELRRRGFDIVSPETLSIPDQIAIFNRAEWVVGSMGSAFHNVFFSQRGAPTKTVQFTWGKPNLRYMMIDWIKGNKSYYALTMDAQYVDGDVVSTRLRVEDSLAALRKFGALDDVRLAHSAKTA